MNVSFKKLYLIEDKVSHLMVDGIGNIQRAIVRKENDEFVIFTEGSDLKAILRSSKVLILLEQILILYTK